MPTLSNIQIAIASTGPTSCVVEASFDITISAAEAVVTDFGKYFTVFAMFKGPVETVNFEFSSGLYGGSAGTKTIRNKVNRPVAAPAVADCSLFLTVNTLVPTPKFRRPLTVGGSGSFTLP